jgi:hypothetical protein
MIIKIFSDFCDSSICKNAFEQCCKTFLLDFYGKNKNVYIVDDEDENYSHVIILNKAMPKLNIPKENVIGLAFEPYNFLNITEEFIDYSKKHIGKYFIGDKRELPEPFVENFGYLWFSRPSKEITEKKKIMSIILSNKKESDGHKYRHNLVKKIIENNLPIDIFGRGSLQYSKYTKKTNLIKGPFNEAEPYEDYLYTIAIENFRSNHYFSEKIINPIMYNCSPIYVGCKNIHKYFDDIILLSGNINYDMKIIYNILREPFKYYKKSYTEKHEKNINLLKNIETIFNG